MPGARSSTERVRSRSPGSFGYRRGQWHSLIPPLTGSWLGAPFRSMVVAATGYALIVSLLWPSSLRPVTATARPRIEVLVEQKGSRRLVVLRGRPKVGAALRAAGARLVPEPVLAARSHQPIAHRQVPPVVLLDGSPATRATVMSGGRHTLEVGPGGGVVEPVVTRPQSTIPAPPMPRVLHNLWHPGSPGLAGATTVGEWSGEVVSGRIITEPSAPTPVTDKVVALTFDDGPWPDTAQFLGVLQAAAIKATFCMIGHQVLAHPEWARAVAAAGMTLCNHTLSHDEHLDHADPARARAEVHGGAVALSLLLGQPPKLYRPPGGTLSPLIEDDANAEGEQVMHWSVDPSDWKKPGVDRIVAAVLTQVRPGAVIALHDGGGDRSQTLAALPLIITKLQAQGYRFTTPDAVRPTPLGVAQPIT